MHVVKGELTKPRREKGNSVIPCKAARMGALPVRGWEVCPLTCEEEEAPDCGYSDSPKGTGAAHTARVWKVVVPPGPLLVCVCGVRCGWLPPFFYVFACG